MGAASSTLTPDGPALATEGADEGSGADDGANTLLLATLSAAQCMFDTADAAGVVWLDELPLEVLKIIISYLDVRSGLRLQTTCRHYTYEELFWKGLTHLSLRPFWHRVSQEALVRIIEGKPLERELDLGFCNQITSFTLARCSRLTNLTSLDISSWLQMGSPEWVAMLTLTTSLKSLIINNASFGPVVNCLAHFTELTRLEAASPHYSDFTDITSDLPPKILNSSMRDADMTSLTRLTRLEVLDIGVAQDSYLSLTSLTRLQVLTIRNYPSEHIRLLGQLPLLTSLTLYNYQGTDPKERIELLRSIMNVNGGYQDPPWEPDFYENYDPTQPSIMPALSMLRSLHAIEISSALWNFDVEDLEALASLKLTKLCQFANASCFAALAMPHFAQLRSLFIDCEHFKLLQNDDPALYMDTSILVLVKESIASMNYLEPLSKLRCLQEFTLQIDFSDGRSVDASPLADLPHLEFIDLSTAAAFNTASLAKLKSLRRLLLPPFEDEGMMWIPLLPHLPALLMLWIRVPKAHRVDLYTNARHIRAVNSSWYDATRQIWRPWGHHLRYPIIAGEKTSFRRDSEAARATLELPWPSVS